MTCLVVPAEIKQQVLAALDRLPIPTRMGSGGKVSICFEFNLDPHGKIGTVIAEHSMRESITR